MNFNLMDIIVLAIFALSIFSCYKKGLVKSLFGMFRIIIALFIAISLAAPVGDFLRGSEAFYNIVYSGVSALVSQEESTGTYISEIDNQNGAGNLADLIQNFSANGTDLRAQAETIRQIDIPSSIIYGILSHETAHRIISEYITNLVINIVSVVLIFITALLVLKVLAGILDAIASLPLINIMNKLGGVLIGFVQGAVIVWIIITVIGILPFSEFMVNCYYMIENSTIAVIFI